MKPSFHPLFPLAAAAAMLLPVPGDGADPSMQQDKLSAIDAAIETAIDNGDIPGAVLWLESKGEIHHKAYGRRLVTPGSEEMTGDTIFDVASLTKVMATTPAILKLLEEGRLDLDDPVSRHIPEFLSGGVRPEANESDDSGDSPVTPEDRKSITVRHLLTHQSGLPPGIFLSEGDFWGHREGVRRAATVGLIEKPGTRFRYSDVNFILLGEIVARVSGQRLDQFTRTHFFEPLGMTDTTFLPAATSHRRIAPTTVVEGYGLLRGQVHDPTSRRMEGVAGHAGLFSSAKDVATYVRTWLAGGGSMLGAETVGEATTNQLPASMEAKRGLGWDIHSRFSSQRGEKFPREGFGHTGWTGTSIWVDPASETFLILLSNRNHPSEEGRIKPLRIQVGTLAAEAVGYTKTIPLSQIERRSEASESSATAATAAGDPVVVRNGIDVLERDGFAPLVGKKIGLITNHTGINHQRRSTIDLLAGAPNVELVALFSPEHGIRGVSEADSIDDGHDAATGLPVYSLYQSETRKPSPEQLKGLDALVFDIQDIGCRFYTYVSTMGLALEAAKEAGIPFVVLDRVNPIGGVLVDGPVRKGEGNDFVAFHDIPVQHGMTVGELAGLFNAERKVEAELRVIRVEGWSPEMRFDETGLPWVNPSPNMRSLTQALLYPGVGLVEFTNLSVGRGTDTPFEHIGAPWLHDGRLARQLNDEKIPGIQFLPTRFTPAASVYEGEDCAGVRFFITDRDRLRPLDLGIALMRQIHQQAGDTFNLAEKGNVLLRHPETIALLLRGADRTEIRASWQPELNEFLKRREPFLLYPRN
ncbi:MAG: DUF1343 domain-containing protein [Verrucomicrobiaceae bacterium]|nr:DUF1343 domain-containing protein [Verrucomicrobiaceae bacterium]